MDILTSVEILNTIIQWFSHGITHALKDGYVKSKREGQIVFSCYTSDLVIYFIYFFK